MNANFILNDVNEFTWVLVLYEKLLLKHLMFKIIF